MITKIKDRLSLVVTAGIFVLLTFLYTALAWSGDKFAIVLLASLSLIGTSAYFFASWLLRDSLRDWIYAVYSWENSVKMVGDLDNIMIDSLKDLAEYDEEAAEIHIGRAGQAVGRWEASIRDAESMHEMKEDEWRKKLNSLTEKS